MICFWQNIQKKVLFELFWIKKWNESGRNITFPARSELSGLANSNNENPLFPPCVSNSDRSACKIGLLYPRTVIRRGIDSLFVAVSKTHESSSKVPGQVIFLSDSSLSFYQKSEFALSFVYRICQKQIIVTTKNAYRNLDFICVTED